MRNQDGLHILVFCVANNFVVMNTFFRKNKSKLITFSSGGNYTQIDFILVRREQLKNIKHTKVISYEECITQHKLLFYDFGCIRKTCQIQNGCVEQKEFEQAVQMIYVDRH